MKSIVSVDIRSNFSNNFLIINYFVILNKYESNNKIINYFVLLNKYESNNKIINYFVLLNINNIKIYYIKKEIPIKKEFQ